MQETASQWFVIVLALVAANLPFIRVAQPFWRRFVEWLVLYGVVVLVAWGVEKNLGALHPQSWSFYVVTFFLFMVAAYPGYVWRYLWRHT